MPKIAKILLICLIVLLLLGLVSAGLLWLFGKKNTSPQNVNNLTTNQPTTDPSGLTNTGTPVNSNANVNNITAPLTGDALTEQQAKRFAIFFAEKFGTFSSQGDFENFRELYSQMTPEMLKWAQTQVSNKYRQQDPYFGTTTRSLRAKLTRGKITDANIQITVDTQREERGETPDSNKIVYQAIQIDMVRSGNSWLVSRAQWK